jgi:large subunit ribosomal protein L35
MAGSTEFEGSASPFTYFPSSRLIAMPKQKTHKGTKKRFRITARGKVKHRRAGTSHLQSRLTKKRRRNLRGTSVLAQVDTPRIVAALADGSY